MTETAHLRGNLVIGGDSGIRSVSGAEAPPNCVPTPRFDEAGNCFLAPRQRYYTIEEVALHSPDRPSIVPRTFGIPCCRCRARGTVRVRPRVYFCQAKGCGAWSLVVIGKELSGGGLKTIEYQPEEGDEDALRARLG